VKGCTISLGKIKSSQDISQSGYDSEMFNLLKQLLCEPLKIPLLLNQEEAEDGMHTNPFEISEPSEGKRFNSSRYALFG
jgi:hypothetical protein